MPQKKPTSQPNYAPLYTSLANSKTQQSNNALYQTIFLLIKQVSQSKDLFVRDIAKINTTISAILNASFMTVNDESHLFFNSRQTLAGTNITFDDTVPHKRTINASGGGAISPASIAANALYDTPPTHDVYENEIYATLVNSSFGSAGSVGPTGPAGAQGSMGPPAFDFEPEYVEPLVIPGSPGAAGVAGANGAQGNMGPPAMEFPDYDYIEPMMIPGPAGAAGAAGASSTDDFAWFMGS